MKADLEVQFVKQLKDNQRIIHKVCKIYTDDPNDHQDLFQEVCVQLWKSFPNFRGDAKFSTWMYRIALNTAMSIFKKSKKLVDVDFGANIDSIRKEIEHYEDDSEKIKKMYDAIHQLNDIEKALVMMYLDDKNYREISEILGITEGNA